MEDDRITGIDRRNFIRVLLGGGAFVVANGTLAAKAAQSADTKLLLNFRGEVGPFITIQPDNSIIVGCPSPEIGTGMHTTAAMLVAEEVGADFETISVRQLPVTLRKNAEGQSSWAFGPQGGGGSFTTRRTWRPIRQVAALTRDLLLRAAAEQLGLSMSRLSTSASHIQVSGSGERFPFSDFATLAATMPFPELDNLAEVALKDVENFDLIGSDQKSKGVTEVVTGDAVFGIDAEMPDMLHASILHAPTRTATIGSIEADAAMNVSGVTNIVRLEEPTDNHYQKVAIAVVAETYWAAQRGLKALKVDWVDDNTDSTKALHLRLDELVSEKGAPVLKDGQGADAISGAHKILDVKYVLPSIAHGTMEPMNCIVHAKLDEVVIIEPGHNTGTTLSHIARRSGLDMDAIHCELTRTGGSFGRRLWSDYVVEAYEISKKVGRPVKLVWSRESDLSVDGYRVTSCQRLRAGLDAQGKIVGWHHTSAHATTTDGGRPPADQLYLETVWEGNFPRNLVENFELDFHSEEWSIMQGPWRAPMPSQQGFITESFVNELAEAAGTDPLAFRLGLLRGHEELPYDHWGGPTWSPERLANCLQKAADEAGWFSPAPAGRARGIAGYFTFGSYCALVVETSMKGGRPVVHKVTAALDCGLCLNPNGAKAQIEGGINDALSATLYQEAVFEQGRAVKTNFDSYQMMLIADAPPSVDTHIIQGSDEVFGTGEISVPPFAAALTDSIFQLTGKRIRKLPIADQLV